MHGFCLSDAQLVVWARGLLFGSRVQGSKGVGREDPVFDSAVSSVKRDKDGLLQGTLNLIPFSNPL